MNWYPGTPGSIHIFHHIYRSSQQRLAPQKNRQSVLVNSCMALAQFCWCSRRYLCLDLGVLSTNHPPAMLFEHQTGILGECTGCPMLRNAMLVGNDCKFHTDR